MFTYVHELNVMSCHAVDRVGGPGEVGWERAWVSVCVRVLYCIVLYCIVLSVLPGIPLENEMLHLKV